MRNNEERTGSKKNQSNSTAATQAAAGLAPLEFVRPTTIVALPTEGKFYPEGHPLHNQDTVEIRQMTTAEEDILSSRTLLRKGLAIDKFLERLLVDSQITPDQLTVSDKNALIIQARIDGYGSEYTTQISCPACTATQKYSFDLDEDVQVTGGSGEGSEATGTGTFTTTLDNDWVVEFKALTGADEKRLVKAMESTKKAGLPERTIQDQLTTMIVSVSGHTDKMTIAKAVEHMTGKHSRQIREAYKSAVPNVEIRGEINCNACGTATEMEVPLTADFFWART